MNTKHFNVIGVSRFQGVLTFRVSNGDVRHKEIVLARAGHTDVEFKTLPQPMTKADAVQWMRKQGVDAVVPVKNLRKKIEAILAAERAAAQASTEGKLAAKRARDAARKREKRAAERAAREAAKQAGVNQLMEAVDQEFGVDVERELAGQ